MERKKQKWALGEHPFYEDRTREADWRSFGFEEIINHQFRVAFRLSCKDFGAIYLTDVISHGAAPNPGTLANRFRLFRRLVRWMIAKQIYQFKDITSGRMIEFLEDQVLGKTLTKKHIQKYLHVFEKLWAYRGQYGASLTVDPSSVASLYDICDKGAENKKWEAVPIEDASDLIRDAVSFIDNFGEVGFSLLQDIDRLRGSLIGLNNSQMRMRARYAHELVSVTNEYKNIAANVIGKKTAPVREVLRELIRLLLGAALIVIFFFTGMRCSEVLTLKVGCYSQRRHKSGGIYWYVDGVKAKSGGLEREWVVPSPVIRVLSFLENFHAALMGDSENDFLFALPDGNGILPPPYVNVRRLWSSTASDLIKKFATSSLRSGKLLPNIHPHQARKTFARFVVLQDKSSLESLAQHYGHLYTALLDGAYVGIDVELHQLLSQEVEGQIEAGLTELMTAKNLGGKAGSALVAIRKVVLERFQGHTSISTMVKKLVSDGVVLSPCDWGYCIYAVESSACGGTERGPNLREREPNVCSSCANFAVTERHRQWWENRLRREEEFLANPDHGAQAIEIAEHRYKKSQVVLVSLNRVEYDG